MKLGQAADILEQGVGETLTYYHFLSSHWRRIRTNNPLERIMREIRRRTNIIAAFPDGNSALVQVAAWLRHIAGRKWSSKRYLNMQLLMSRSWRNSFLRLNYSSAVPRHKARPYGCIATLRSLASRPSLSLIGRYAEKGKG